MANFPQLQIPWSPAKAEPQPRNGKTYLVNSLCTTFRWHEKNDEAALTRAALVAKQRKSSTTVYEEIPGDEKNKPALGPRLASFAPDGRRYQ